MKVQREKEEEFRKVTITLETEIEARICWHLFNMPLKTFLEHLRERQSTDYESINNADGERGDMWKELNDIYRPESEE